MSVELRERLGSYKFPKMTHTPSQTLHSFLVDYYDDEADKHLDAMIEIVRAYDRNNRS